MNGKACVTDLFFSETRAQADNVYNVALYNSNIGEMFPIESFKLLSLSLSLFLLLCKALMTVMKGNR